MNTCYPATSFGRVCLYATRAHPIVTEEPARVDIPRRQQGAQKLYANLIKKAIVKPGPAGLYPKPLVWMEAKDMEGFNAHFAYGFITEPGTLHPMEGMVVHPYDEVLVFAGYQDGNVRRIDAEISIVLGEERETHTFHRPTYVVIPRACPTAR